jgi:pimeloyl-ACP methyl ester carboxylesterase
MFLRTIACVLLFTSCTRTAMTTTDQSIAGPGGRLHVERAGTGGVPVVFLHSFGGSSAQWADQLDHIRTSRQAVALDFRGHGRSEEPRDTTYTMEAFTADIGATLDSLEIPSAILVGHGFGGSAALAYATAHPDRVAGLVLVVTPGKSPPEQASQMLAALRKDFATVGESFVQRMLQHAKPDVERAVRKDWQRMPRATALAIIETSLTYDPLPALRSFRKPILLIDAGGPGTLHSQAPTLPHKSIGGASHWLQMDRPAEFNAALDGFLGTVAGSG